MNSFSDVDMLEPGWRNELFVTAEFTSPKNDDVVGESMLFDDVNFIKFASDASLRLPW